MSTPRTNSWGAALIPRRGLLGAALFLLQRGLGAGITIYAPAIVLSTVMGWALDLTIVGSGLVAIAYTVSGGSARGEPDAKVPDRRHLRRHDHGLFRSWRRSCPATLASPVR